jgi:SET domain-containing protein
MPKFPKAMIAVKPSKMLPGEVGLFALRPLKKGTIINKAFVCGEKFFSSIIFSRLDKITKKCVTDFCTRVYDGFFSVPDINYVPISWFSNHSCDPNIGFNKKGDMVLMKNVKAGEELTQDYGFSNTDPKYKMRCRCGSKNCRKIITAMTGKIRNISRKIKNI